MMPTRHQIRHVLKPRVPGNSSLMRVKDATRNTSWEDDTYLIEPCDDEFPFRPNPLLGSLRRVDGRKLHEEFEYHAEAPT